MQADLSEPLSPSLADRFWPKVDKAHPSGCWLWTGARSAGYGSINLGPRGHGTALAHRVSWALAHGHEADGLLCHSCDNRACVNPDHLFVGTHADNSADMRAKGRFPSRTRRNTKLSDDDALNVVGRYLAGERQADLAAEHGVTRQTISYAIRRHFGAPPSTIYRHRRIGHVDTDGAS